jgi:hypothetical protein
MKEPMHRKNIEGFRMQTKAPYDDGASKRGGTYILNQVRMHACHLTSKHCTYFLIVPGKSSMKSSKKKKESLS